MKKLLIGILALTSVTAFAGGGGGCEIPVLVKDKTMTCKGSFLSSKGIFNSSKSFSRTVTFDNEIDFDNSSSDVNYLLYKTQRTSGYEDKNLNLSMGCDSTEGSRVKKYGKQYISLGDFAVSFQLGNGKNDTGVININSDIGSGQVRCVLK